MIRWAKAAVEGALDFETQMLRTRAILGDEQAGEVLDEAIRRARETEDSLTDCVRAICVARLKAGL